MRRWTKTAKSVVTWGVATGVGIGVSWFGVRPLLDAAVPDRLAAFPDSDPRTPLTSPALSRPAGPEPSGHGASASPGAAATLSSRPGPSPTSPAAVASTPVPDLSGWTATGDGQYVRTFRLTGGDATVRAGHGAVELVSATPRPGYVVSATPAGSNPLGVSFTMINRASKLEVEWVGNGPVARTTEIP